MLALFQKIKKRKPAPFSDFDKSLSKIYGMGTILGLTLTGGNEIYLTILKLTIKSCFLLKLKKYDS